MRTTRAIGGSRFVSSILLLDLLISLACTEPIEVEEPVDATAPATDQPSIAPTPQVVDEPPTTLLPSTPQQGEPATPEPVLPATPPPEEPKGQVPPPCTNDCTEMLHIPGGTFAMGAKDIPGESKPQHQVTLTKGYWMDRFEVSERRYKICKDAGVCPEATAGLGDKDTAARGITWEGAVAFCRWAGKRLPTEAEWEHAGCGDGTQCYPWGGEKQGSACTEEPTCDMAAFCPQSQCAGGPCYNRPKEIEAFTDTNVSFYGLVNMGGNVWEWVQDRWTPNFEWCREGCTDPLAPGDDQRHVFKGGAWISEEVFMRCAARYHDGEGGFPDVEVGLRCAADE
ncbi:MAG: hypothetical protein A2284_13045 [Deltaproteobacteria bacterium RIFOXYA12_FULL_61_11]|nr:MAG: hypothetical protein A2284_13045 [Deltaproteobacteria bacterium RIFOXYA12_FULL_61_11]